MKTFYCVTTTFNDRGKVTAAITAVKEAEEIPESGYTSISRRDIYTDWFDTIEAAEDFVKEAKEA